MISVLLEVVRSGGNQCATKCHFDLAQPGPPMLEVAPGEYQIVLRSTDCDTDCPLPNVCLLSQDPDNTRNISNVCAPTSSLCDFNQNPACKLHIIDGLDGALPFPFEKVPTVTEAPEAPVIAPTPVKIETEADETNVETIADETNVETIADETNVETIADETNVETEADETDVETEADENNVETIADENNVETIADETNAETTEDETNAETTEDETDVETTADETNVESAGCLTSFSSLVAISLPLATLLVFR